jgi:hypothetical protein
MAIESISRGALAATCIERHYPTAKLIERGAAELGIGERVKSNWSYVCSREVVPRSSLGNGWSEPGSVNRPVFCIRSRRSWEDLEMPVRKEYTAEFKEQAVAMANEAKALHESGKHAESIAKAQEAAKAINLNLQMKK